MPPRSMRRGSRRAIETAATQGTTKAVSKARRSMQNRGMTVLKKFAEFCIIVDAEVFLSIRLKDGEHDTMATFTSYQDGDWRAHARRISAHDDSSDVVLHLTPDQYREIWENPQEAPDADMKAMLRRMKCKRRPWLWDSNTKFRIAPQLVGDVRQRRAHAAATNRPLQDVVDNYFGDEQSARDACAASTDTLHREGEALDFFPIGTEDGAPEPAVSQGVVRYLQEELFACTMRQTQGSAGHQ